MFFSACREAGALVSRGFSKGAFGKRHPDTFRRFYCAGRRTRETAYGSSRVLLSGRKNNDVCFSSASISSHGLLSLYERFRNFSTTRLPPTLGIESATEPVKYNKDENETSSKNRCNQESSFKGGKLKVLTLIEPSVRRKPFQNFRHSAGSKRDKPNTKRIFVDSILNGGESHRNHNLQQRDIFGSTSPMSPFVKPGNEYGSYPVIAIQVARSIDLSKVISKVFATKGVRKMRERLSVVAQLPPSSTGHTATEAARFVAVFRFGSVVFFNVSPKEIATLVEEIKKISTGSLSSGKERKDRFCVHVQPPDVSSIMDSDESIRDGVDEVTADYCIVPELNMKSVDVISNVMAQSVALDAYNDTVDELLADFERINNKVTLEGNLSTVDRDKMFRAVAQNNSIFLKLTKVGIKDRVDTAWNLSQYENVSEGMREEFDIDRRFEHIEFKLNLIQQNAKFFLEVLANQKSDSLEWIIIVLILLECILMCVEMSGMGEPLFAYLGKILPSRPSVP